MPFEDAGDGIQEFFAPVTSNLGYQTSSHFCKIMKILRNSSELRSPTKQKALLDIVSITFL